MSRKIGEGHAAAMFRLGFKELRNAVNPSRESVADTEVGLYGSQTQGEIAKARGGPGSGPEQESAAPSLTLDDLRNHAKEKAKEVERGTEERGQEREKGHEREHGGHER